ncbi:pentapeptide repeat-containing protein [Clostridium sp.]|uniref:pentapeptide repeat-containing protein n=1 Tax=Clostridium sp. TaxID=1506 RepID=UPI002851C9AF|nr:pentapeptide repeat-containing protein [Clostridium sp.]MDR3596299.1 pentapeptide repeat-containing protein [Clostridium sp.]
MSYNNLQADCGKCFGLCCVALYFSAAEGFPINKDAGRPCINLQDDFRCSVHNDLMKKGLKGCRAYDCLGAGQRVVQVTYCGYHDWRQSQETAKEMFEVFIIMRQLHEMLWYLMEALTLEFEQDMKDKINSKINEIENLTHLSASSLIKLDLIVTRVGVNALLLQTSELVRKKVLNNRTVSLKYKKTFGGGLDLIGKDLRKQNFRGANLSGSYIIAANLKGVDLSFVDLLGADLRDADLSGANLSKSIYLTQAQVNTAKGDVNTKLPNYIVRPMHWSK